jgi:hypothetical protein
MKTMKEYIPKIVAKLYNEGIKKSNYQKSDAIDILNQCVAPVFCIKVLNKYEKQIIKLLPL